MKRILVVDDHAVMRDGIRAILADRPGLQIAGEASNGIEAVDKAVELDPDLTLMDISMPSMDGIEACHRIVDIKPAARILILSKHESPDYILSALKAGAAGYVPKKATAHDLLSAIEAVIRGDAFLYPSAAAVLVQVYRSHRVP